MPAREDLPSTLRRSPKKAQDTYAETHDSAVEQYGEGERAHRTAFSAVKHSFEKVGDHWEPKLALVRVARDRRAADAILTKNASCAPSAARRTPNTRQGT